jgi:RNA polymerase sigma-70 factor, ECF subfamily
MTEKTGPNHEDVVKSRLDCEMVRKWHPKSQTERKLQFPGVLRTYNSDMTDRSLRGAGHRSHGETSHLSPSEFACRFEEAWTTLWYIAAAVLNDRAGVDDVLQESGMIALGKLPQFESNTNFTAWMATIVRFVALNHARRRGRTTAVTLDQHGFDAPMPGHRAMPAGPVLDGHGQLIAGNHDLDDRVLKALNVLDETARACLLLRTVHDMPYREISLALNIAEGTAMSHVHRARNTLRGILSPTTSSANAAETGSEGHDDAR